MPASVYKGTIRMYSSYFFKGCDNMIEIGINKITKDYGFGPILNDISFEVKTNERIALVGENGSGKSSLLNIIAGTIKPDSGTISIRKNAKIAYLKQLIENRNDNITVKDVLYEGVKDLMNLRDKLTEYEEKITNSTPNDIERLIVRYTNLQTEFINMSGYEIDAKVEKVIKGFKIDKTILSRKFNSLSGGEKTIITLASIIISEPDILLLDEPTNYLDIDALEWLEDYLRKYKGTILMISHDRYFLDEVATKIILLENKKTNIFHGNYTKYLKENEERINKEFKDYKDQQKQIKAMEASIKRLIEYGNIAKNEMFFKRAESIRKRLDKLEKLQKPIEKDSIPLQFRSTRSGNIVLELNNININYPDKTILKDASLKIFYQEKICLLGNNGSGKSSLVKYILTQSNNYGTNIKIGYIPQEISFEDENKTVYEEAKDFFIGDETHLRSALSKFYFFKDNILKRLKNLSGGEKVRLKLFCLIQKDINFLILDEPTNHIDIETKEILESALKEYKATLLFISHDRYFINSLATRIIYIEDYKIKTLPGNYNDYKHFKDEKKKGND